MKSQGEGGGPGGGGKEGLPQMLGGWARALSSELLAETVSPSGAESPAKARLLAGPGEMFMEQVTDDCQAARGPGRL